MLWRAVPLLLLAGCASSPPAEPVTGIEIQTAAPEPEPKDPSPPASRETECNRVIALVNASVSDIERISAEPAQSQADIVSGNKRIGDTWEKLADDLDLLQVSTSGLRDSVRKYLVMCRKISRAARQIAVGMETRDTRASAQAQKDFDEMVAEEDVLIDRINAFCQ